MSIVDVEAGTSPLQLEVRAVEADRRAAGLEQEMWAARREAAQWRALAGAYRARDAAGAALAGAEDAAAGAQAEYERAGAGEREAMRRVAAAEREAERSADALAQAREDGAEPVALVELEERLAAAGRVLAHEREALARTQAATVGAKRAAEVERGHVREARAKLASAEEFAAAPTYIDPASQAGRFNEWIAAMAPAVRDGIQSAGLAAR